MYSCPLAPGFQYTPRFILFKVLYVVDIVDFFFFNGDAEAPHRRVWVSWVTRVCVRPFLHKAVSRGWKIAEEEEEEKGGKVEEQKERIRENEVPPREISLGGDDAKGS